jgi:hypothetical protein
VIAPTVTLDELAAWLGARRGGAARLVARLERRHGFPARLPGAAVWPRRAVLAWIECAGVRPANGDASVGAIARADAEAAQLAAASAMLEARYLPPG